MAAEKTKHLLCISQDRLKRQILFRKVKLTPSKKFDICKGW